MISNTHMLAILDSSIELPFSLNDTLVEKALYVKQKHKSKLSRARALYTYLHEKISYGYEKRLLGYASALEVWQNKQGVCGEMSYLYIGMARLCEIPATYVHVSRDYRNKRVNHACAGIDLHRRILVDIAYNRFDILHADFVDVTDSKVLQNFLQWKYNH